MLVMKVDRVPFGLSGTGLLNDLFQLDLDYTAPHWPHFCCSSPPGRTHLAGPTNSARRPSSKTRSTCGAVFDELG